MTAAMSSLDPTIPLCTGYVAGRWLPAANRVVCRENPARCDEIAARWCPADPAEATAAMEAAGRAFGDWSQIPPDARFQLLDNLARAIETRTAEFARLIVRESGKTLAEAKSEVAASLGDARFLLKQAGCDLESAIPAGPAAPIRRETIPEAVGVYLLITPWNFPLATILRKLFPALAYGNSAVVKPSELAPGPAHLLFELIAGLPLPTGTVALVPGFGAEIGPTLLDHQALRGISFTGSTRVGLDLARRTAGRDVRLQLEMGGKNTLVVLADADVDAAVEAAVVGGFSCAGQWCTGTGRVVVEAPILDDFCDRLIARTQRLRVGPGDDPDTEVGPVATAERVEATLAAINTAVGAGARLRCGGARANGSRGHFFQPTVLDHVNSSMGVFQDELFAPVLPIAAARDREDARQLADAGTYGLSASVFSADLAAATAFARRLEAGMVHVNLHTAYRDPALPVAGWRDSGRGIPECGRFARDFFSRPRALYVRHK